MRFYLQMGVGMPPLRLPPLAQVLAVPPAGEGSPGARRSTSASRRASTGAPEYAARSTASAHALAASPNRATRCTWPGVGSGRASNGRPLRRAHATSQSSRARLRENQCHADVAEGGRRYLHRRMKRPFGHEAVACLNRRRREHERAVRTGDGIRDDIGSLEARPLECHTSPCDAGAFVTIDDSPSPSRGSLHVRGQHLDARHALAGPGAVARSLSARTSRQTPDAQPSRDAKPREHEEDFVPRSGRAQRLRQAERPGRFDHGASGT